MTLITRRSLMLGIGAGLVAGCDSVGNSEAGRAVLFSGETAHMRLQRALIGDSLAREYSREEMSPRFRMNGSRTADSEAYRAHLANGFADWRLVVDGLVQRPLRLSLDQVRAMPARTQITRHDCVEGWSAIGEWHGPQLSTLLDAAGLRPAARYLVFHCADRLLGRPYYESIDLVDALHPQTILAWGMNRRHLPEGHGAPLRLRVERQLGYKQAKFIMRIEAVADLASIAGGKGGLWEDIAGYEWYGGI